MENIGSYFGTCVAYWMSTGVSEGVATCRAIWWDCVEVWNADKSWNDDKISFVNKYRQYKPYDAIPDEDLVNDGNA